MVTPEQIDDIATDYFADQGLVARAMKMIEQVEAEVRKDEERLFWEACQPHGKVGEVVYLTYKAKRDAAIGKAPPCA